MRLPFLSTAVALLVASGAHASPTCDAMRLGYIDQHRPPFYIGNGANEQVPPGAAVDLVREMAGVGGCPLSTLRLPAPRIRLALVAGQIDVAQIDAEEKDEDSFALPMNKGVLDRERSLAQYVVVFVRAADGLPAGTDPTRYFRGHKVGVSHGARYAARLRAAGVQVDDGAIDAPRNLEKVLLGRIDGFAVTLSSSASMDELVAERYGGKLVRLNHPLLSSNAFFAVNKGFYAAHRAQVEAMWDWIGVSGRALHGAAKALPQGLSRATPRGKIGERRAAAPTARTVLWSAAAGVTASRPCVANLLFPLLFSSAFLLLSSISAFRHFARLNPARHPIKKASRSSLFVITAKTA